MSERRDVSGRREPMQDRSDDVLVFPAQMSALPRVTAFTADVCAAAGLDRDVCLKLTLLVEELFTNTVAHGYGGDSDAPVRLGFAVDRGRVRMTYEDHGPPHDPFASGATSDQPADADSRRVGGVGLRLVAAMASAVEYERAEGRNRITLTLATAG